MLQEFILIIGGLVAGFIDSIAGGGGMITLPILSLQVGAGAPAIGTNKIVGLTGAFIAMLVYLRFVYRSRKLDQKIKFPVEAVLFCVGIGGGAYLGSLASPHFPKSAFKILLTIMCPVILWISYKKDLWITKTESKKNAKSKKNIVIMILLGGAIGFYDGFFGPGGGTFMFLALFLVLRFPLFVSLAVSKLSNSISAGVSLGSYFVSGYVHPREGLLMAMGMAVGSFLGSSFAVKKASGIIRPILALVSVLLILRLWFI